MKYKVIVRNLDYELAEKIIDLIRDYSCCIDTSIVEE